MKDEMLCLAGVRLDAMTYEDFDLLLEAIDAAEKAMASDGLMGAMIGSMLARSKEEADDGIRRYEEEKKRNAHEVRIKKEAFALLRAKLILARKELDCKVADEFVNDSSHIA